VRGARADSSPPRVRPRGVGTGARTLARAGAEREGDLTPGVTERRRQRQMEDDTPHRADHVDAQLEQPLAQRGDLGARAGRAGGPQSEFLYQHVRRRREEDAQLVDPEAAAARPIDLESVVEFLDPIFDVPRAQ
jgi:hypothetical protein